VIVKHTYTRDRGAARVAVRYYQLRPRGQGEEPRTIFTRDDTISRAGADRMMREHQNGNFVVHRVTLSPSDRERPEDLRDMARYVMAQLEHQKGQRLHWFAVEHRNTDHHHVHVMIAGAGERELDGAMRSVKLTKEDYASMREEGQEYCRMICRGVRWEEPSERPSDPDHEDERYAPPIPAPVAEDEDEELKRRRRKQPVRTEREGHDR